MLKPPFDEIDARKSWRLAADLIELSSLSMFAAALYSTSELQP
jgi:hypothetical protein